MSDIISQEEIPITAQGYSRTALISTCRQIREDTLAMFYCNNRFFYKMVDYNADPACQCIGWSIWKDIAYDSQLLLQGRITYNRTGGHKWTKKHWKNLMTWCRHMHEFPITMVRPRTAAECARDGERNLEACIIGMMTTIVVGMKDVPWEQTEAMLQECRHLLAQTNARWNIDYS